MILINTLTAFALLAVTQAQPQQIAAQDHAPLVRRVAATVLLAAQEYRLGFQNGRVVATAEIDEARLFLTEAARAVGAFPPDVAGPVRERIEIALAMVNATAPPDSVAQVVEGVVASLSERFGVAIDETPAETPSLARGAALYQIHCARCHGALGAGDGRDAKTLDPPPTALADHGLLSGASPLDFYRQVTVGIAGTAMPGFETMLTTDDRWAVALYASTLRLPAPAGSVAPALAAVATTASMSDDDLQTAMGPGATLAGGAAVRTTELGQDARRAGLGTAFAEVRARIDSAVARARAGETEDARRVAFDAYLSFERVEREVRIKDQALAAELEASFAGLREQAAAGASAQRLEGIRRDLLVALEKAERAVADRPSGWNLFLQSFMILIREGLEAILVIGALVAFLVKTGAQSRRRDIRIGVGAALAASLLTALAIETIFFLTPAKQELLEGITMAAAAVMLFYVSYWLLSKVEVARWNAFVKDKVRDAVAGGSALSLAVVAFLAVYREGFETVLFYKALFLSAGGEGLGAIGFGALVAALVLVAVYVAINRYGVRLPLKPFFTVTSAFLYYMAFVFAGQAVAELQAGGAVGTTVVEWAPRLPVFGIYPTVESLLAQATLVVMALVALAWIFGLGPVRARRRETATVPADAPVGRRDMLRSLDRIEADVNEIRAEIDRMRSTIDETVGSSR